MSVPPPLSMSEFMFQFQILLANQHIILGGTNNDNFSHNYNCLTPWRRALLKANHLSDGQVVPRLSRSRGVLVGSPYTSNEISRQTKFHF